MVAIPWKHRRKEAFHLHNRSKKGARDKSVLKDNLSATCVFGVEQQVN
jgi:hypothetical protein